MKPHLTLFVMTLNEEANILECLRSARDIADQVVVLDTGSTDRTRKLAADAGAEVYVHEPVAVSEYARDKAMEYCRGDWVLVLDADERATPELTQWIDGFLRSNQSDAVRAVALPVRAWFFGDWLTAGSWWPNSKVSLFRRSEAHWGHTIHVQPVTGEGILRLDAGPELAIQHYAYPRIGDFVERTLGRYTEVETELRRHRPAGALGLSWAGMRRMAVELVWKRGYRDGTRGFVVASLLAMYDVICKAKAWEREHSRPIPAGVMTDLRGSEHRQ